MHRVFPGEHFGAEYAMTPIAKPPRKPLKVPATDKGKARTSLRLPQSMLHAIHQTMDADGTSRKRRSQWIAVAVERFFALPGAEELVLEEFLDAGGNDTIPVSLPKTLKQRIDHAVEALSRQSATPVESSALLRTAISQYLLRARRR